MEPPDRTHQGIATYDIFISFRGGDRELARRLRDALTRLSPARVFLDERSVLAGEQWAGAIEQAVQRSRAMIALVGPAWGLINDPGAVDWVRQELELALRVGVPILPVVVGEASRAKLADLAPAFTAQAQALRPEVPANQAELILLALARLGVRSVQPYSVDVRHVELDGTVRQQVLGALQSGNVIVCGNAGSGRSQLLAGLAAALATEPTYEHALVIGGRGRPIEAAARYAIVTNWFNELAALLRKVASAEVRQRVVSTCCANGGLLIRRGVLPARLLLDLTGGAADRQVVELLRRRSELGIMTQRSALIDEAVALLLAVPAVLGKKDLILLVDDYHELDSGSGIIVDRLAQHERVRVVATTSEPPPGRLVGTRIVLTPPVAADTSSVELGPAREYLDGLNRDRYLRALTLDHLIAEHSELETGDEAVRLSLPANPASSLSADRLIRHRLDQRITDRARAALSVGALMHNPFPFDTAYRVANAGSSVVEATAAFAALADADREGMLVRPLASEAGLCRVRFADDRVRSLLQAETPAGEHPALHQRIADLLEEDASRFADDLLISTWELVAYHRSQAEDHRRAAEAYRIAGRLAEQSVAGSAARRNYRRAVNALSRAVLQPNDKRDETTLLLVQANTSYRLARLNEAALPESESAIGPQDAASALDDALRYAELLDDELPALEAELRAQRSGTVDDRLAVPPAELTHHTRRLRHALTGYIKLLEHELRQQGRVSSLREEDVTRQGLLEVLQHAEAAQAEGGASWLMAEASANYAAELIEEAEQLAASNEMQAERRRALLRADAFIHLERALRVPIRHDGEERHCHERAAALIGKLCSPSGYDPAPLLRAATQRDAGNGIDKGAASRFEHDVWRLSRSRLTAEDFAHAEAVRDQAGRLVELYGSELQAYDLTDLRRDLAVAAAIHDWYGNIDPGRTLTLARDWQLPVTGFDWATPDLLHGKLSADVARVLYRADARLGAERWNRIEAMISNHVAGGSDPSPAEQLFFIADSMTRTTDLLVRYDSLAEHHAAARRVKWNAAYAAGRPMLGERPSPPLDGPPAHGCPVASHQA